MLPCCRREDAELLHASLHFHLRYIVDTALELLSEQADAALVANIIYAVWALGMP